MRLLALKLAIKAETGVELSPVLISLVLNATIDQLGAQLLGPKSLLAPPVMQRGKSL